MTVVVDLDGTLCSQESYDNYIDAKPRLDVIKRVNELWTEGHDIVIHTARGMNTFEGRVELVEQNLRSMTEKWLRDHRVCYTRLVFGKPAGDVYVDDKAQTPERFASSKGRPGDP